MTRAKAKTYQQIVTENENKLRAEDESARIELAAARERVPVATKEREVAEDQLAEIEASFSKGLTTFAALDHATAQSDVIRTTLAEEGARQAVDIAKRGRVATDTELAEIVARAVSASDTISGDVISTFNAPKDRPASFELPLTLVVQKGATDYRTDGSIGGDVEIQYFKTSSHKDLNADAIKQAADALGIYLDAKGNVRHMADGSDLLRVSVRQAHVAAPLIPTIDRNRIDSLGRALADDLAQQLRYSDHGVSSDPYTGLAISSHVAALPYASEIVSEEFAGERRTLTVETKLAVRVIVPPAERTIKGCLDGLLHEYAARGRFIVGLGVVDSFEFVDSQERDDKAAAEALRKAEGTGLDVNQIGFESLYVQSWTIRAVLTSSR